MEDNQEQGAENPNDVEIPESEGQEGDNSESAKDEGSNDQPLYVQKRLKQQRRQHERELRALRSRIDELESNSQAGSFNNAQFDNGHMPQGVDETIAKAVSFALQQKDAEARKMKEQDEKRKLQDSYNGLYRHLDSMGDKYDDFHDIVFGEDTRYTPTMRDFALTLPHNGKGSAGEVLYHLGKKDNRPEFERIAMLSPIEQAREMTKLSHALMSGGENKVMQRNEKQMPNFKASPMSSSAMINDKTPVSSIRQRMKEGKFR